jgi:hypothetical protein
LPRMKKPDREIFILRGNRRPSGADRSAVWSIEIKGPPTEAAPEARFAFFAADSLAAISGRVVGLS